ncbi:MAG: YciI family protein [Lautropia sp.]
MPQFVYRVRPTRLGMLTDSPTEREAQAVGEHFAYLSGLTDRGTVLMAGRTLTADEQTFGIAVLVADTPEQAEAIMNGDPAVEQGVMRAELFPFQIVLWSENGPPEAAAA